MAQYNTLKDAVAAVIKTNGNKEITGELLQQTLLAIITSLGAGFQYMGVAAPSTNPGTPDQNVLYIAGPGTYPNFNGAVIPARHIGFLSYNGTWSSASIETTTLSVQDIDDGIIQMMDGDTPVFPRTKAEGVIFNNDNAQTLVRKIELMLTYTPSVVSGGYVDVSQGTITPVSSYDYVEYLPILSGQINTKAYFSDAAGIAFYDINKSFISSYRRPADVALGSDITIDIPTNACYMRVSYIHNYINTLKITGNIDANIGKIAKNSGLIASRLDDAMAIDLGTLQNGAINATNGNFITTSANKRTDKIRLNASRISIKITHSTSGWGAAFYDVRGVYISGISFADYNIGEVIVVNVPSGACYFATCATNSLAAQMVVRNVSIAATLNKLMPISDNPCYYIQSSEARTFKKVLCIGDSLTEGAFEYKEDGATIAFVDQSLAWPTFFAAISGRQTTNAGDSGESTKTWWEIHQNDDLSGHDACVIALGRNDYVPGRETTSAERIQYMTNIVNKVKAENPQIKIFISTLINYYTGDAPDAVNADMRTIAATLSDCFLVDISLYGNLSALTDRYSHCTAAGYQKLAECYFRYISYIMANNPAEFMNIQFIGTNRSY